MKRDIIHIDEELCNGCGECIPNCHEGALQIIDGKARLISDLKCDGLGACIGHCPLGAISIENREAEAYDEIVVIKEMVNKGKNTLIAHLKHLKEHGEKEYLQQGVAYLESIKEDLTFDLEEVKAVVHFGKEESASGCGGACPGAIPLDLDNQPDPDKSTTSNHTKMSSSLRQWPVQMHLINPGAQYFRGADLLFAADCIAFTKGDFHQTDLPGKKLVIACPKLDTGLESYTEKIKALIDQAMINTITVMMMEVPCCSGLLKIVQMAAREANRKVPVKMQIISVKGEIIREEWV